jgi:hypothetical protein
MWPDLKELRKAAAEKGAWILFAGMLLLELIQEIFLHRILAWVNDKIDQESGGMILLVRDGLMAIDSHRFIFFLTLMVLYGIVVILVAQISASKHRPEERAPKPEIESAARAVPYPFHPSLESVGRRIEGALYGSSRKSPDDVTHKVLSLAAAGVDDIPVNHYKLCDGHDPDEGEDNKFLTVTMSETVRQHGHLYLPLVWLRMAEDIPKVNAPKEAPRVLIEYASSGVGNQLTFFNDGGETAYHFSFAPLKIEHERSISLHYSIPALPSKNKTTVEVDFESEGMPLYDFMINKVPDVAKVTTELFYEDQHGRRFSREYTLEASRNRPGVLIWNPGPIKEQEIRG